MANSMVLKRDALKTLVTATLQNIDANFNVEDRFRTATFDASNRNARVSIMGDPVRYCEVLYAGRETYNQTARSTRRDVVHLFEVSIWYAFQDADTYEASSQAVFDRITDGDDGVLKTLQTTGTLENSGIYAIDIITAPETFISDLSNNGKELAHFLGFNVGLRFG